VELFFFSIVAEGAGRCRQENVYTAGKMAATAKIPAGSAQVRSRSPIHFPQPVGKLYRVDSIANLVSDGPGQGIIPGMKWFSPDMIGVDAKLRICGFIRTLGLQSPEIIKLFLIGQSGAAEIPAWGESSAMIARSDLSLLVRGLKSLAATDCLRQAATKLLYFRHTRQSPAEGRALQSQNDD